MIKDIKAYFTTHKNATIITTYILNVLFWVIVAFLLFVSSYGSGQWMLYQNTHDHHLAFFLFLSGMAAEGIIPGVDFYSPHSVFIPIVNSIFLKIFGINQINLAIFVGGVSVLISFICAYKTARFVMPSIWAKFAIVTILISYNGDDLPWFNHIFSMFIAMGIYFLVAYIKYKKNWYLIALGFVCFCLPYLRQQGLVTLACFLLVPMILYYINAIPQYVYKTILKYILGTFLLCNVIFLLFIVARNGFEGLEILYSSFMPLVSMAQPLQAYPADFGLMAAKIFNYTSNGYSWHNARIMLYLSYYMIFILPCIYYAFRPLILYANKEAILNEDIIKFITAVLMLSTLVLNYPIQEDARMKVHFTAGAWLFVDVLYLTIYKKSCTKSAKFMSILTIAVIFIFIHNLKMRQYNEAFAWNFYNKLLRTKQMHIKMPSNTPYANLILSKDYAEKKLNIINILNDYMDKNPDKKIIFDGDIENAEQFLSLLFTRDNVAIAHKFPYYYSYYNREDFMPDINEKLSDYVDKNKPIILGCKDNYISHKYNQAQTTITDKVSGYEVLVNLNEFCDIFIPKGTK